LAAWTDRESAQAALAGIVAAPLASLLVRAESGSDAIEGGMPGFPSVVDEAVGPARVELARDEAAIALARSGRAAAIDALIAIARGSSRGQRAALDALAVEPPAAAVALNGVALTTPGMIALAARIADLRTLDAMVGLVHSSDPLLRSAAVSALAVAGDARDLEVARAAAQDPDPRVRVAAADALVRLNAADAEKNVVALVADDATALDGLRLTQDIQGDDVTKAAAARAMASADTAIRAAAVVALGRQTSTSAVGVLQTLLSDPLAGGDAACALAHSPSRSAMGAIEASARSALTRRLAARAYFVRRYVRGERSAPMDDLLSALARSADAGDRVVGGQFRFAFGLTTVDEALADPDPRVRRAIAMSVSARRDDGSATALLARMNREVDDGTRTILAGGLIEGDPLAIVATSTLFERARAGGPDAPLAAMALGQRAGSAPAGWIETLVGSPDPVVRAHAARGLGRSRTWDATARLVQAFAWETQAEVRRAIVAALVAGDDGRDAQGSRQTIDLAATLDPDPGVRWLASHDRSYGKIVNGEPGREVAWIRLVAAYQAELPSNAIALWVGSDGTAIPIAFDDDGYALVPGVPAGESRLRLAPRLPAYSPPSP
jgi:HEAT repeat protein